MACPMSDMDCLVETIPIEKSILCILDGPRKMRCIEQRPLPANKEGLAYVSHHISGILSDRICRKNPHQDSDDSKDWGWDSDSWKLWEISTKKEMCVIYDELYDMFVMTLIASVYVTWWFRKGTDMLFHIRLNFSLWIIIAHSVIVCFKTNHSI